METQGFFIEQLWNVQEFPKNMYLKRKLPKLVKLVDSIYKDGNKFTGIAPKQIYLTNKVLPIIVHMYEMPWLVVYQSEVLYGTKIQHHRDKSTCKKNMHRQECSFVETDKKVIYQTEWNQYRKEKEGCLLMNLAYDCHRDVFDVKGTS